MPNVREALNALKWKTKDLKEANIVIRHRGAKNDEKTVKGSEIQKLESWCFQILDSEGVDVTIPYHRILRIEKAGEVVWEKRGLPQEGPE